MGTGADPGFLEGGSQSNGHVTIYICIAIIHIINFNQKSAYVPTVHEATAYMLLFLQPLRANVTIRVHGYLSPVHYHT